MEWADLSVSSVTLPSQTRLDRRRRVRLRLSMLLLAGDVAAVLLGFAAAGAVRFGNPLVPQAWLIGALVLPVYLVLNSRAFGVRALSERSYSAFSAVGALAAATALLLLFQFFLRPSMPMSRFLISLGLLLGGAALIVSRAAVARWSRRLLGAHPVNCVLILDELRVPAPEGVEVVQAEGLQIDSAVDRPFVLDWLARSIRGADVVYIACPPQRRPLWSLAFKGSGYRVEMLLPELDRIGALGNHHFAGLAAIPVSVGALRPRDEVLKRALDLALVIPAVLFLAPLLLTVALCIKLDSPGPVFFIQPRVGRGNRLFPMFKFRSMRAELCDVGGEVSTTRTDMRVTRVGRFIRATSIDELPQLLNILLGTMSFVGPRPHALGSLAGDALFWQVDERYFHRHACKPGLTGLAQVRGFRGATHRREDLVNRRQADLEYINGWSVWRDISILFATVRVVVHRNAF